MPYVAIEVPFMITHKLPGLFIFCPVVAVWVMVISAVAFAYPSWGKSGITMLPGDIKRFPRVNYPFLNFMCEAERTGYLTFLPVLYGLNVLNELLTFAPTYLYAGEGW